MNFQPLSTTTDNFIFSKRDGAFYINNLQLKQPTLVLFLQLHGYDVILPSKKPDGEWVFYHNCLKALLELEELLPKESNESLFEALVWFLTSNEADVDAAITKIKLCLYSSTYNN